MDRPMIDDALDPTFAGGRCAGCRHSRAIRTARGSTFRLCERSTRDARYPRYPRLPVISCAGFEPRES